MDIDDGKAKKYHESNLISDSVVPKQYVGHFIMLVSCFILWGLLNNMTDNLVPAFGKIFMMKSVDSSYVQMSFYGAYAVLAIPAAIIIKKWSYRTGVLMGLGLYIVGAFGYIPASILQNYNIFLVSIFILAGGLSILETTCNPFIISLGSEETSVRRLNFAQAFNPMGSLMGILLAKFVILGNLNEATYEQRLTMSSGELKMIRAKELMWLGAPYIGLIVIAFIIWIFFYRKRSSAKDEGGDLNIVNSFKTLLSIPRYVFGVITQFFYVGMQIAVWTWMTKYVMTTRGVPEDKAVEIYLIAMLVFIACRWICTGFMKKIDPAKMMTFMATLGVIVTLGAIYLPTQYSIICLILISGCMSLMFPTIYGIALKDLGEEVKLGAAGLIMAILGGAVITPFMGKIIDSGVLAILAPSYSGVEAAVRTSYFVAVLCFVVILAYSVFNRKKVI
ncbi:L-fucose:H+ symporter permease [Clostridium sp. D2Q-14]|nr:L-fucose:H+ symporter permease [Anaeromonas gelatinilytica]